MADPVVVDLSDLPDDMVAAIRATQISSRIDLVESNEVFPGQVLAADLVKISAGVTLTIGNSDMPFVVFWAKKLILPGGDLQVHLNIPKPKVINGSDGGVGTTGADGTFPLPEINGKTGEQGDAGTTGKDGGDLPVLGFFCDEVEYVSEPIGSINSFVIHGVGVNGGSGGMGGMGGTGGRGFEAIPGFSQDVSDGGVPF